MATTYLGFTTVHGISGTLAYTGMSTSENILESINGEDSIQEKEILDKEGEVVGLKLWRRRKTCTIKFYPAKVAGSGSIAAAKALVDMPANGAVVTLASMPTPGGTPNFALNDTKWIYVGGATLDLSNDDDVAVNLPVRRYTNDISTAAT